MYFDTETKADDVSKPITRHYSNPTHAGARRQFVMQNSDAMLMQDPRYLKDSTE